MDEPRESSAGLLDSLRRLVDTGLGLAQGRLELLSVELQQEKHRFVELLVWTFLAVALGLVAVIVVSFTIVVLFWESARVPVLVVLGALYIAATIWAISRLRRLLRSGRRPLHDTIEEFKKDRACL
jgi:uncharacterized membrane protein YqjE